jgi:hypothetical protein
MPHIQGLRNPPQNKIASIAVITTRSIRALSRVKSTTETKNSASRGIRVTLAIVVINLTLRLRDGSIVGSHFAHPFQVLIALEQSYKLLRSSVSEYARDPAKNLLVGLLISQHHFPFRASLYMTPERILSPALFHDTYQERLHSVSYSSVPQRSPPSGAKLARPSNRVVSFCLLSLLPTGLAAEHSRGWLLRRSNYSS